MKLFRLSTNIFRQNTNIINNHRSVSSLSSEYYTCEKKYEIERRSILGSSWQCITHESALINTENPNAPATYLTETIAGFPVILIRNNKTGEITGNLNICRHRGGPLEWDNTKGICKLNGLKCKYHGWTYSFEGKLKGMPIFGEDSDINKNDLGLWPIRIARWRGFIFAQIIPDKNKLLKGEEVDKEFINSNSGFIERIKDVPLENWNYHSSATHKLECNWKVYVENYLEGYHIPNMHPGLNKMVDMKDYRVLNGDNYVEHIVSTIPTSGTTMGGVWLWLSPTLAINTYEGGMSLERIVPTGPLTCEIRYQYLFDKNAKDVDISIDTSTEVTAEDIEICEAIQKSFSSGGYYSPGPLSPRHENGVAFFQNIIRNVHSKQ